MLQCHLGRNLEFDGSEKRENKNYNKDEHEGKGKGKMRTLFRVETS